MKVLLLAGGNSNERDVSLRSGQAVAKALESLGHEYRLSDPADTGFNLEELTNGIDVVFPALHGEGGEDGILQAELERMSIPFVGSDSQSSALCFNKWRYKQLLQEHNLPASEGGVILLEYLYNGYDFEPGKYNKPFVLKPVRGGSSLDTIIVRNPTEKDWNKVQELLSTYKTGMLYEPIIDGVEITIGILDDEPLPVIEIIPPEGKEFDYDNKYNGATQELCPPQHVGDDLQLRAQELALKIHNLTGCYGMSRTDMIIDPENNLHVLETNTIPGLTEQSLLPKMAATAGYTMPELVDKLINLALSRQP